MIGHHRGTARSIKLSESNKERLLSGSLQSLESRRSKAEGILRHLGDTDSAIAQKSKLKEVELSKVSLRMLLINEDHSQSDMNSYIAPSYCTAIPRHLQVASFHQNLVRSFLFHST